MCNNYFKEIVRVLSKDGVLLIVSLLQPHVLKILLDFFVKGDDKSNLFSIRLQQIENIQGYAEKDFIKYFVSIKKSAIDTSNPKMVEMRDKMQDMIFIRDTLAQKERSYSYDKAIEKVKVDQQIHMIAPTL